MSLELSGTTGVKGVAGSVSAPSIVGDDTNTGISFPSADTIKFSTGGVERMQISNSGVTGTGVGGKIKQVVYKNVTNSLSTTSSSYSDMTNYSLAITPTSSSNILYFDTNLSTVKLYDTSGVDHRGYIALTDDGASSYLQEEQFRMQEYGGGYHLGLFLMKTFSYTHIKTAGSTSARTYQMRFKLTAGEQFEINAAGQNSSMVIWEIEP